MFHKFSLSSLHSFFFKKSWKKKGQDFPSTPAAWKPSWLCPLVVVPNMKYRSVVADIYRCNLSGNKSLECTAQIGLSRRRTIAIALQVHSSRIEHAALVGLLRSKALSRRRKIVFNRDKRSILDTNITVMYVKLSL